MQSLPAQSRAIALLLLSLAALPASGAAPAALAPATTRLGGVRLESTRTFTTSDTSLTCFEGPLSLILNPGCFSPPAAGDCVAHSSQYFVQYITPNFSGPHRIKSFGFISNDGTTVFPAAGIVLIPSADNRFPRPAELASLQVHDIVTPHDTAVVAVDMRPYNLSVGALTDVVVCLRFPEGGELRGVGDGPGILVDEFPPDQRCDFFTVDGGVHYYTNAASDPLDWGFEVVFEPEAIAVTGTTWSALKSLYGGQRLFPYRTP